MTSSYQNNARILTLAYQNYPTTASDTNLGIQEKSEAPDTIVSAVVYTLYHNVQSISSTFSTARKCSLHNSASVFHLVGCPMNEHLRVSAQDEITGDTDGHGQYGSMHGVPYGIGRPMLFMATGHYDVGPLRYRERCVSNSGSFT